MNDTPSNPGQRGAVRNPQSDGRLKRNRDNGGIAKSVLTRATIQRGGQGRVKNPETDRRLKNNR